jgi:prepilin-type N-terminal cleavage/methylation domain-containing protein
MQHRKSQSGFTVLELSVTVALVGALAAIALPSFASSARETKLESEVNAMFAEFRMRQEQHMNEYGRYMSTGTSESDTYPAEPSDTLVSLDSFPATWTQLKIRLPQDEASCAYVVIGGGATDTAGALATGSFGYVKPTARSWYYMLARCKDGASETYYFASNDEGTPRELGDVNPESFEGTSTTAIPIPRATRGRGTPGGPGGGGRK